jgi:hypothetical protein
MPTSLCKFFLLLCCSFSFAALPIMHLRAQTPPAELKFTISLQKQAFKPNQPVMLQLKLENVSARPIVVNTRFLVNIAGGPHEVVLQVIDPEKKTLHFMPLIRASFQSDQYITLPPGKSATDTHDMGRDFVLTASGEYSVRAYYENERDAPAGMQLPAAWKGTLESNKVQFTIR